MTGTEQKVAIITGGSQGIGVGLVEAYRQRGWAVVANSLGIKPSKDPDILTVQGDVSEQASDSGAVAAYFASTAPTAAACGSV